MAHIAGSVNTAPEFVFRLEVQVTKKFRLRIREVIKTTPIELTTNFSGVAYEEQFFFTEADGEDETDEQIPQQKGQCRKEVTEKVANEELSSMKPSIEEFSKIDRNITSFSMTRKKANARIRVERDADLVLKNLKLKILDQPHEKCC